MCRTTLFEVVGGQPVWILIDPIEEPDVSGWTYYRAASGAGDMPAEIEEADYLARPSGEILRFWSKEAARRAAIDAAWTRLHPTRL